MKINGLVYSKPFFFVIKLVPVPLPDKTPTLLLKLYTMSLCMWKLYNSIFTCCNLDKKSSATFEITKKIIVLLTIITVAQKNTSLMHFLAI